MYVLATLDCYNPFIRLHVTAGAQVVCVGLGRGARVFKKFSGGVCFFELTT